MKKLMLTLLVLGTTAAAVFAVSGTRHAQAADNCPDCPACSSGCCGK